MSRPSRLRTGDYLIDIAAREIRKDGECVELEAKAFDLVVLLLEARDRTLSKQELTTALWGNRPVTDAALSQQLRKARRALGDDGDAQRIIRTVHGRGLRWVAEVVAEDDRDPQVTEPSPAAPTAPVAARSMPASRRPSHRWPWLIAAALLLLVGSLSLWRAPPATDENPHRRIAILPTSDQSGDETLAWTHSGLMGLMSGLLLQRGGIAVVAAADVQSASAPPFAATPASADALRRALGASHALATTLRRLGPVYPLEVRLVADGGAERLQTLHGNEPAALAADAVTQARRWLDLDPPATATAGIVGMTTPFTMEAYARGLDAQLRGDPLAAKKYFSICLDHDPGLAWPRLGLAEAQARSGESEQGLANATQAAAAAREHGDAPLLAAALKLLASLAFQRGDLDVAAAQLDEALAVLPPTSALLVDLHAAYGSIEDERGHFTESRRHFEHALERARAGGSHRGEALVRLNLASLDNGAGDAAAAESMLRRALDAARVAGDGYLEGAILGNLGATEANQGRLLEASRVLKRAIALAQARADLKSMVLDGTQLVWIVTPFERHEEAHAFATRLLAVAEREGNPYWQAELHWARAGIARHRHDWPRAFAELERARVLYAEAAMDRNAILVVAEAVATAAQAGDATRAQTAANEFRRRVAGDSASPRWRDWQSLVAALETGASGDLAGASMLLEHLLDDAGTRANRAVAQAALFQLGRWQLALGQPAELLSRAEWSPWLAQHPEAIRMRIAALRASGKSQDADAEQHRLDHLLQSEDLALEAGLVRVP